MQIINLPLKELTKCYFRSLDDPLAIVIHNTMKMYDSMPLYERSPYLFCTYILMEEGDHVELLEYLNELDALRVAAIEQLEKAKKEIHSVRRWIALKLLNFAGKPSITENIGVKHYDYVINVISNNANGERVPLVLPALLISKLKQYIDEDMSNSDMAFALFEDCVRSDNQFSSMIRGDSRCNEVINWLASLNKRRVETIILNASDFNRDVKDIYLNTCYPPLKNKADTRSLSPLRAKMDDKMETGITFAKWVEEKSKTLDSLKK